MVETSDKTTSDSDAVGGSASAASPAEGPSAPSGTGGSGGASSASGGGPTAAGGMIIPDLSAITAQQNDNIQKMTAAVQSASGGLQEIVSQQRAVLQQTIQNLQTSLDASVTAAKAGPAGTLDLKPEVDNLNLTIDSLTKSAETLTAATGKSFDAINKSMQQSLDTISKVAEKFSSGGQGG